MTPELTACITSQKKRSKDGHDSRTNGLHKHIARRDDQIYGQCRVGEGEPLEFSHFSGE